MGKILFFSRVKLVHLYGPLSKQLEDELEVVHLAYSNIEEEILINDYGISDIINFRNETKRIYDNEKLDLNLCQEIDTLIIENSNNRFCLNSAIQSDRTFQFVPYEECLKLAQVYYRFWNNLFLERDIEYILHEANSLLFTQMASIIAKKYDGKYLTQIQVIGENKLNWLFVQGDNGFPVELFSHLNSLEGLNVDISRVKNFLITFRSNQENHLSELFEGKNERGKNYWSFLKDIIILIGRSLKRNILSTKDIQTGSINHVETFLNKNHRSFKEDFRNKWDYFFQLEYDSFNTSDDYFYYPLHFEPEAVVLYWGDGIYKNQVKLIENIAAQLPPNCYLYVKDHPYTGETRDYFDYKRIKAIPNVKVLDPNLSGKVIVQKSRGVITINGTSGFEALLMNKQVYVFGNAFYDLFDRVVKIKNIRDFREKIYINYSKTYQDDDELYRFVFTYLKSVHDGYIAYFRNYIDLFNINKEENIKIVTKGFLKGLKNLKAG